MKRLLNVMHVYYNFMMYPITFQHTTQLWYESFPLVFWRVNDYIKIPLLLLLLYLITLNVKTFINTILKSLPVVPLLLRMFGKLWELSTLSLKKNLWLTVPQTTISAASVWTGEIENHSLALVGAQGHTMQCDQYYQIVTKINLESLGPQLPGKAFWMFYERYLMQSVVLCVT